MISPAIGNRFKETMTEKDFYQLAKLLVNRDREYVIRLEIVNCLGRPWPGA